MKTFKVTYEDGNERLFDAYGMMDLLEYIVADHKEWKITSIKEVEDADHV